MNGVAESGEVANQSPGERETEDVQRQKALGLAVTGVAALFTSYVVLGCLLPVVALVVIAVGLSYGGGAAVLVAAIALAVFVLIIYKVINGITRRSRG